jgi:hypothetical protein
MSVDANDGGSRYRCRRLHCLGLDRGRRVRPRCRVPVADGRAAIAGGSANPEHHRAIEQRIAHLPACPMCGSLATRRSRFPICRSSCLFGLQRAVVDDDVGTSARQHAAARGGEPAALRGRLELRHRLQLPRQPGREKPLVLAADDDPAAITRQSVGEVLRIADAENLRARVVPTRPRGLSSPNARCAKPAKSARRSASCRDTMEVSSTVDQGAAWACSAAIFALMSRSIRLLPPRQTRRSSASSGSAPLDILDDVGQLLDRADRPLSRP